MDDAGPELGGAAVVRANEEPGGCVAEYHCPNVILCRSRSLRSFHRQRGA